MKNQMIKALYSSLNECEPFSCVKSVPRKWSDNVQRACLQSLCRMAIDTQWLSFPYEIIRIGMSCSNSMIRLLASESPQFSFPSMLIVAILFPWLIRQSWQLTAEQAEGFGICFYRHRNVGAGWCHQINGYLVLRKDSKCFLQKAEGRNTSRWMQADVRLCVSGLWWLLRYAFLLVSHWRGGWCGLVRLSAGY